MKIHRTLVVASLSLFALAGCVQSTVVGGKSVAFRSGTLRHYPLGELEQGKLDEETRIDGLPCRGWVRFDSRGNLRSAELASEALLAGHALPAGSRVFLDEQGRLKSVELSRDTKLQGITWDGGVMKVSTGFHADGHVQYGFLADDETIQGVHCEATVFTAVELDPDGKLRSCKLASPLERSGKSYAQGMRVWLAPDGSVIRSED